MHPEDRTKVVRGAQWLNLTLKSDLPDIRNGIKTFSPVSGWIIACNQKSKCLIESENYSIFLIHHVKGLKLFANIIHDGQVIQNIVGKKNLQSDLKWSYTYYISWSRSNVSEI